MYSDAGLTREADPRHAQLAVTELGLQTTRPQTSPGAKPDAPMDQKELESDGQDAYHSAPPRLAHLASDRLDITLACEEYCRAVGQATRAHAHETYRTKPVPYVTGRVRSLPPENEESTVAIDEHSDADVAGCPKTRRSTSGGSLRVGRHALATWSSTQK